MNLQQQQQQKKQKKKTHKKKEGNHRALVLLLHIFITKFCSVIVDLSFSLIIYFLI
jgi:hypothetical protein